MKKKQISILLALALLVSVFALTMLGASAEEGHTHCVCGGVGTLGDHTCAETVEWTPIGSVEELEAMLVTSTGDEDGKGNANFHRFADDYDQGYYYLTADISSNKAIEIHQADDIHLCLNGHTLTHLGSTANSPWRVWGKLSITDCGENGKILNQYKKNPVIYMFDNHASADGTVVNIYGGTIQAEDDGYNSTGIIRIGNSSTATPCVVNMYGGTITGGTGASGGNVAIVSPGAVLNMYDGAITNGKTSGTDRNTKSGGNILITNGKFYMYGGTVSGGTCDTTPNDAGDRGYGHDIYLGGAAIEVVLDCAVDSMDIGIHGNKGITLGENFSCNGTITLDSGNTSTEMVISGANHANAGCFAAADAENDQVVHFDGKILLRAAGTRYGCVCGGVLYGSEDHTCELLTWTPLTEEVYASWTEHANDGGSRVAVTGNYYLTGDLELDRAIRGVAAFNLDLNGYTMTTAAGPTKTLRVAQPISICDSSYNPAAEDYTGLFKGGVQSNGCNIIYVTNTLTVYGGNIGDGNDTDIPIYVDGAGVLNLYNGVVTGITRSSSNGGNITSTNGGTINMYGGAVVGGSAYRGGNIAVLHETGSFNMYGGLVSGGKATRAADTYGGGNIFSQGAVNIYGGVITEGEAAYPGGNIYTTSALTITGGEISRGESTGSNGGNIYLAGISAQMTFIGGTVKDGIAQRGGNIQFNATGAGETHPTHQIGGDAIVSGGYTEIGSAGSVYLNSAKLLISGNAQITGGYTKYSGGNIRVNGVLTVTGGTISDGIAETGSGGNIYLDAGAVASFCDCTISNGYAGASGGGIYSQATTLNIDHVIIDGGEAMKSPSGGCVAVAGGTATITDSTLKAGWGMRGTAINVANAGTLLTITDSTVNGRTEEYGTSGYGTTCWIEGGTFKLVGDVQITGPGLDVIGHDVRYDAATTVDISLLETQEPLSLKRQDAGTGMVVYAGDNSDANVAAFLANQYAYYNEADKSFYLATSPIVGYTEDTVYAGYYLNWADAMADENAVYFVINENVDGGEITRSVMLNLKGSDVTNVTIPAGVTVQLIDAANNDFTDVYGHLSGTVEGTVETFTQRGERTYLIVCEDGAYSAHCYDVEMTYVSLDAANDALGYKAKLSGDSVVMKHVDAFGFNLWVDGGQVKTYSTTGKQEITLRLKNIMAAGGGEMGIHANAFVSFDLKGGKTTTDHATTMKAVIEAVNAAVAADPNAYNETQMAAVQSLVNSYSEDMALWQTEAIKAWAAAQNLI